MKQYRIAIFDKSRGGYLHFYEETTADIFTALINLENAELDIANDPHDDLKKHWEAVIIDEDMYEVHGVYEGTNMNGTPFLIMY